MILSEADKRDPNWMDFVREDEVFNIVDGYTLDLEDTRQRFIWEAIKYCPYIAPDIYAKDA
jgi:hypothetical protein